MTESKYFSLIFFGIALCASAFVLALLLFIFSMPYVGYGYWSQSETAISFIHVSGALASAGMLCFLLAKNGYIICRLILHPIVLGPISVALLSIVFTLFHPIPMHDILGAGQTGDGIAFWFDWAVLSLSALILCQTKKWRNVFCLIALGVFTTIYVLCITSFYFKHPYAPFWFPDFLAFHVFCMIPITLTVFRQYFRIDESSWKIWLALYVAVNALLYFTQNNIGIAYGLIGMPFFILLFHGRFWPLGILSEPFKARIGHAALLSVPLLVLLLMYVILKMSSGQGYYEFIGSGPINTVASRAYLIDMSMKEGIDYPLYWITGQGWGMFTENTVRNLPVSWVNLLMDVYQQWDGLSTDHFHSHNLYTEILISAGVFAVLAFYLFLSFFPAFAKQRYKIQAFILAGAMTSIGSFWFLFPIHLAFISLAFALYASRRPLFEIPKHLIRHARILITCVLVIALLMTSSAAYMTFAISYRMMHNMPRNLTVTDIKEECPADYRDFNSGGFYLAWLGMGRFRALTGRLREDAKKTEKEKKDQPPLSKAEIDDAIGQVNHYFCQMGLYIQNHPASLRLIISRLIIRGEVLLDLSSYLDQETQNYYAENWKQDLDTWLQLAPGRTDQAVPYLLWNFINHHEDAMSEIISQIYIRDPEDPVGLWFKGLLMTGGSGDQAREGLTLMRKALDNGIERFMPVDEKLKQQLMTLP